LGAKFDFELKFLVDEVHKLINSKIELADGKEYVGSENKIDIG